MRRSFVGAAPMASTTITGIVVGGVAVRAKLKARSSGVVACFTVDGGRCVVARAETPLHKLLSRVSAAMGVSDAHTLAVRLKRTPACEKKAAHD